MGSGFRHPKNSKVDDEKLATYRLLTCYLFFFFIKKKFKKNSGYDFGNANV